MISGNVWPESKRGLHTYSLPVLFGDDTHCAPPLEAAAAVLVLAPALDKCNTLIATPATRSTHLVSKVAPKRHLLNFVLSHFAPDSLNFRSVAQGGFTFRKRLDITKLIDCIYWLVVVCAEAYVQNSLVSNDS